MTIDLDKAIVYDIETFPNCFILTMECFNSDLSYVWEVSEFKDDRQALFTWFDWLRANKIAMIGFNSLFFDYVVIHAMFCNRNMSYPEIYARAQERINSKDRFGGQIWERDRFAPQIDLFKIHHFDNKAKTTSLKALEINMRSERVVESAVPFGTWLTRSQIDNDIIPYGKHDTSETKKFAHYSRDAMDFRIGLIDQFGLDVMNYNDTKIGEKILENRIGLEICYDFSSGRKKPRQTIRTKIELKDIIFPYIKFQNPEFNRVLDYMKAQTLKPEEINTEEEIILLGEEIKTVVTKGVFKNLNAQFGGLTFHYGTGGVHASVSPQVVRSSDEWILRDIDVEGLYPNIAIVNNLAPAHLGPAFTAKYKEIPDERKKFAKGTYMNAGLKLAANGAWGKSNSKYSVFFDSQYAMTVPINGQLMLSMLAEWLGTVPTIKFVQVNTDGITYLIHRDYLDQAKAIEKQWEKFTLLKLEDVEYETMWIRDVNNYIAMKKQKPGSNEPPELKLKGAYWSPDANNYAESISKSSPPAWHKDLGNIASIRAAIAAMTQGIDPALWLHLHRDPFDFMLRTRAQRGARLMLDGQSVQSTLRYYVAQNGGTLEKISPALGPIGAPKRKQGVTEAEWLAVMQANNWQWDASVCTGNKSIYEDRTSQIEAGWKVALCNDARDFDWSNLNYQWYLNEAKKIIIT